MTNLERQALATVPLSLETVRSFFDGTHSGTEKQCLHALCLSHERLRMELQGAETLLAENEKVFQRLVVDIGHAINMSNGQHAGLEMLLCRMTSVCVEAAPNGRRSDG